MNGTGRVPLVWGIKVQTRQCCSHDRFGRGVHFRGELITHHSPPFSRWRLSVAPCCRPLLHRSPSAVCSRGLAGGVPGQRVQLGQPSQPLRPGHNAAIHAGLVSKALPQIIQAKAGPSVVMAIVSLQGGHAVAATMLHSRLEAGDHKESGEKKHRWDGSATSKFLLLIYLFF